MTTLDERQYVRGATTPFETWPSPLPESAWGSEQPVRSAREIAIDFRGPNGELRTPPVWVKELQVQLNELLELPNRWDGHRACPVNPMTAVKMARLLLTVMEEGVVPAQIFPLPDGGLLAEWRAGDHQIEMEIDGEGHPYAAAMPPLPDALGPDIEVVVPEPDMTFEQLSHARLLDRRLTMALRRLSEHASAAHLAL